MSSDSATSPHSVNSASAAVTSDGADVVVANRSGQLDWVKSPGVV